jgi:hypothetical protein
VSAAMFKILQATRLPLQTNPATYFTGSRKTTTRARVTGLGYGARIRWAVSQQTLNRRVHSDRITFHPGVIVPVG